MFRNPRSVASIDGTIPVTPALGRPPTPPSTGITPRTTPMASSMVIDMPTLSSTPPSTGKRGSSTGQTSTAKGKSKAKANGSILAFFKRTDSANASQAPLHVEEDRLFVESSPAKPSDDKVEAQISTPPQKIFVTGDAPSVDGIDALNSSLFRFNEEETPSKRRKIDVKPEPTGHSPKVIQPTARVGPFLEDSDDENNVDHLPANLHQQTASTQGQVRDCEGLADMLPKPDSKNPSITAPLEREATSVGDVDEFDGIEDFIDDEFPEEGEEYLERRWMEEQAQMEMDVEEDLDTNGAESIPSNCDAILPIAVNQPAILKPGPTCPMCGGSTAGLSEQQTSIHVNDCLDGKAKPLLKQTAQISASPQPSEDSEKTSLPAHKRLHKAAIARPGQENPFNLTASAKSQSSSAFSKIMSGHAEDNAWAAAAASEAASRGKPAYQRTCPFYKILPGFYICVDAFRYGAVQGCNAYFLSHFHSDHYIGLTSLWCHGPIYCSRVTGNLVRRQLRVDPKWVVDLEFEKKVEVPNTQGVEVTMIPANHCPGSSLFFFEKDISRGKTPRMQRVLHCGDFRACPAHVKHPKLRPDILDTKTGRAVAQQKIDVCYLDTTYLTPKYAFPSQEEVIRACGEMCVSLSKDFVDKDDSWEQTKKDRAGSGMVKFVQQGSVKEEPEEDTDVTIKVEDDAKPEKRPRGRLLVIVGTYSIGKERICLGVAKALKSKIYAPPNKQKIVAALEDPELSARMTDNPLEAQVHMQMLMEIRAETLADYLTGYKPHFSRIVGFRPSGWNYRPPNSRFTESPSVQTVLYSENWKSRYSMAELVPQRGSTKEANCFGVPYSEHSSFRELSLFCCALRIDKIIPTVNIGSAKSREKMKGWFEKWAMEKKKNGLLKVDENQTAWN